MLSHTLQTEYEMLCVVLWLLLQRLLPGVYKCRQVFPGVHKCTAVLPGVYKCSQVFISVHKGYQVCTSAVYTVHQPGGLAQSWPCPP